MNLITEIRFSMQGTILPGQSQVGWIKIHKKEMTQVLHLPGHPLFSESPFMTFISSMLLQIPLQSAIASPQSLHSFISRYLCEILPSLDHDHCHHFAGEIKENFLSLASSPTVVAAKFFITVEFNVVRVIGAEPVDRFIDNEEQQELPTERGVSEEAIERLRQQMKEVVSNGVVLDDPCGICLEELSSERNLMKLPCLHLYHDACVIPWLLRTNSCPTCRSKIES